MVRAMLCVVLVGSRGPEEQVAVVAAACYQKQKFEGLRFLENNRR
jgi:hypothetical protein